MNSPDRRYRIEQRALGDDPRGPLPRIVEAASGAVVFDASVLESSALLEFNLVNLAALYVLYSSESMAYWIDPRHRLYKAINDAGWLPLAGLPEREHSRVRWINTRKYPKRSAGLGNLSRAAGKSILGSPGEMGPGAPFPPVALPCEDSPLECTLSADGRYRIDLMRYPAPDPQFGDPPLEIQRLVEAATEITIFDMEEVGRYGSLAFDAGGIVKLRVVQFLDVPSREYLLDPDRRIYAKMGTPTTWLPMTGLREEETAIQQASQARRREGTQQHDRPKLLRCLRASALGAVIFGGLGFYPMLGDGRIWRLLGVSGIFFLASVVVFVATVKALRRR